MQYNFFKWIDPRASKLGAILSVMVASMITHSELLSWYYCICQKRRPRAYAHPFSFPADAVANGMYGILATFILKHVKTCIMFKMTNS